MCRHPPRTIPRVLAIADEPAPLYRDVRQENATGPYQPALVGRPKVVVSSESRIQQPEKLRLMQAAVVIQMLNSPAGRQSRTPQPRAGPETPTEFVFGPSGLTAHRPRNGSVLQPQLFAST